MFVPIILGSDKTTVSVATGQNEYYPLYASIGNIHNNVRRAHCNGLVLIGFLAIPKSNIVFLIRCFLHSPFDCSRQKVFRRCYLPKIPSSALSPITCNDSRHSQTRHDNSRSCTLSRWSFSTSYIWTWTIYCRLSRAGPSRMHRPGLVSKVRTQLSRL